MRVGMCGVAVLIGAMGIVSDVAAENNSSLAPLIPFSGECVAGRGRL